MAHFYPTTTGELITAVQNANDGDTIHLLSNTTYAFTAPMTGTQNALPVVTSDITIEGNGATLKPSTTHPDYRLLEIGNNANVVIDDVAVQDFGGANVQDGGAIFVSVGELDVQNSTFINNKAQRGGAIYLHELVQLIGNLGLALVNDDNGKLAVCYDYLATSPQWHDLSGNFTGNVCDFDWDYNSDYFANGHIVTDKVGVYVCTIDGTTFRVYRIVDVTNPASVVELLTSATMSDNTANFNGRIKCSEATPTYCIAVWKDATGIEEIHTTNGGTTWSSKANVGSAITDSSNNDDAPIGLDVIGTTTVVTAPDSSGEYGLYIATSAGGAFSAVTSTQRSTIPNPMIKLLSGTTAYSTLLTTEDIVDGTVNFDGGYGSYVTSAVNMDTGAEASGGRSGNCYKGTDAVYNSNAYIQIVITLAAPVDIYDIIFYARIDSGTTGKSSHLYMELENTVTPATYEFYNSVFLADGDIPDTVSWQKYRASSVFTGDAPFNSEPYSADKITLRIYAPTDHVGCDIRFDDISWVDTATSETSVANLYKVTTLTGTSSWADVSPATDKAPVRPHDLAIDIVDSDVINTVSGDNNWYQSVNAGAAWTNKESSTSKRTPYSAGDAILFGGSSEVVFALEGTSFADKTGNLATVWSSIGTIKRILAL